MKNSRIRNIAFRLSRIAEFLGAYAQGKGYGAASIKKENELVHLLLGRKPQVAIDIGGNVGDYTAELRRRNPNLEIHVFEPSKILVSQLLARFVDDKLISVCPFAVSDTSGGGQLCFRTRLALAWEALLKESLSTLISILVRPKQLTLFVSKIIGGVALANLLLTSSNLTLKGTNYRHSKVLEGHWSLRESFSLNSAGLTLILGHTFKTFGIFSKNMASICTELLRLALSTSQSIRKLMSFSRQPTLLLSRTSDSLSHSRQTFSYDPLRVRFGSVTKLR